MHLYNYYENMSKAKNCGEELTFQSGGNNLMIPSGVDIKLRVVVKLNTPSATLSSSL